MSCFSRSHCSSSQQQLLKHNRKRSEIRPGGVKAGIFRGTFFIWSATTVLFLYAVAPPSVTFTRSSVKTQVKPANALAAEPVSFYCLAAVIKLLGGLRSAGAAVRPIAEQRRRRAVLPLRGSDCRDRRVSRSAPRCQRFMGDLEQKLHAEP